MSLDLDASLSNLGGAAMFGFLLDGLTGPNVGFA